MSTNDLTADAIKEIERLAVAAKLPAFLKHPGDPEHCAYLVDDDGHTSHVVATPEPAAHELMTPEALAEFAKAEADVDKALLFYDDQKLVLVLDKSDRRDQAFCNLVMSQPYRWLKECSGTPIRQADFIRLLRVVFRGCLPPDSNLLGLVRNLKFDAANAAASSIQHGRESLGRSITATVSGESSLPEEVTLTLPVWENFITLTQVVCAVEVLPHEQQFRLTPYPNEMAKAVEESVAAVRSVLEGGCSVPCYHGQP